MGRRERRPGPGRGTYPSSPRQPRESVYSFRCMYASMAVQVLGARGEPGDPEARLSAARGFRDLQILDARFVCGADHLISAAEHAERAMREGTNVAKSLA